MSDLHALREFLFCLAAMLANKELLDSSTIVSRDTKARFIIVLIPKLRLRKLCKTGPPKLRVLDLLHPNEQSGEQ